ncbi:MAG: T9SS type A sorting domain-containing protein [Bacteroidota bacterium]
MINLLLRYSALMFLCVSTALAQIPNTGFENWTGNNPDGWATSNAGELITVTASNTAHSGSYSARGEVISFFTTVLQPVLQIGPDARGYAYTQRPAAFTGYYQFFPTGGDRFAINVALFKGGIEGTSVALAAAALSTNVSSWTQFSTPFTYFNGETPDTCIIQIQIVGPGTGLNATPHAGSYFLLDDLDFSGTTGIAQNTTSQPIIFYLEQNYPNPFNPSTTVEFTLPSHSMTKLVVYNTIGQEIAVLVNGELEPGFHSVTFNGNGLPSGIYYYKLTAGTNVGIGKMNLLK